MTNRTLIRNCGLIVSGDLSHPIIDGDYISIDGELIVEIGMGTNNGEFDVVIDAEGATVIPGLIDSHGHPVCGDFTPRQNSVGWLARSLHGGVTSIVSAGETHWPGRSRDGVEAVAICAAAHLSWRRRLENLPRVFGGALLLDHGVSVDDIQFLHDLGVRKFGEIGLGSEKDLGKISELVSFGRDLGWVAPLHFGGASVPGSSVVDMDMCLAVNPSVISHANGGPTARPLEEIYECISRTDSAVEIVFAGNMLVASKIIEYMLARDEVSRLQFGTDTPSGTGVAPIAMLRIVTESVSRTELAPEVALCAAGGLTASRYGLDDRGVIRSGAYADLVVIDAPLGSGSADAFASMQSGNVPAVGCVIAEGNIETMRSVVTPPPTRNIRIC